MVFSRARLSVLIASGLLLNSFTVAKAQQAPAIDKALVQAALVLRVFDQLSDQCKAERGFNSTESASIAAWEAEQGVSAIRTQTRNLSADIQGKLDKGATALLAEIGKRSKASPCALAVSLTKLPEAKFAAANLGATPRTKPEKLDNSGSRTTSTPSGSSRLPQDANVAKLVATIDSFGFNMRTVMGIGGFLTQDIYPVVLFRNGEALTDVKGLTYAGGLDAYRRAHPEDWTQWQRSGGQVQLKTSKGWKALPFPTTYQSLPSQFRLNGTYRSLSGTGNVAFGGSASVAAWRSYTFFADGRMMRGNGAGSSASAGDSSVVTASVAPNQRGRYQIDGLVLRISYDDGSTENRIIITDPKDPKSVIWLDGTGYVRRKK